MGGGSGHSQSAPVQQAAPEQQQVQYAQPAGYADQAQDQQMPPMENPCMGFNRNLISCLQQNRGEISFCQSYMDMLTQCERDQTNMNRF